MCADDDVACRKNLRHVTLCRRKLQGHFDRLQNFAMCLCDFAMCLLQLATCNLQRVVKITKFRGHVAENRKDMSQNSEDMLQKLNLGTLQQSSGLTWRRLQWGHFGRCAVGVGAGGGAVPLPAVGRAPRISLNILSICSMDSLWLSFMDSARVAYARAVSAAWLS